MTESAQILIVDDEALNRDLLEQEIELLNYKTVSAEDGREALNVLSETDVDLILLDIMMPGIDGIDLLRLLKEGSEHRHIPVVMISALDDLETVVRCIELGAEDYLPKPFDPILLKARIGACLDKKRLRDKELSYLRQIEHHLEEIERHRRKADELLHAILPASAVTELKENSRVVPRRYNDVVVLFGDIVGFTGYCDRNPPEIVVSNLDGLIHECEDLASQHSMEKIKTIGDGIMLTGNLLKPLSEPVIAAVRCAMAISEAAQKNEAQWQMRFGIHTGSVVAGVVGRDKFIFDLWGDTVNVAARLSGLDSPGAVYVTGCAWQQANGRLSGEALGHIPLKGKGGVEVYRCDKVVG